MTGFTFRRAVRENVPLLIGLAGGTGSGKTWSAMTLAKGLTPSGKRFAVIDTEAGRAKHYADQFAFDHGDLAPPFRPDRYAEAIAAADAAGYPVIVVDSMSHEWSGEGGCLDWQEAEYQRMGSREAVKMSSWIAPKRAHKAMMSRLLQLRAHLILCFRAEPKVDMVKNPKTGKTEVVEKVGPGGFRGWLPIAEKNLPYELTTSILLMAEAPGVPKPIKLQEQHRPFFPLDKPISEAAGRALGEWARGGASVATPEPPAKPAPKPAPKPAGPPPSGLPDEPADLPPAASLDAAPADDLGLVGDWRNELMAYMGERRVRPIDLSEALGGPFGMEAVEAFCRSNSVHWRALVDRAPKRGAA